MQVMEWGAILCQEIDGELNRLSVLQVNSWIPLKGSCMLVKGTIGRHVGSHEVQGTFSWGYTIITDNNALTYLNGSKRQIQNGRWAMDGAIR
jgi:hypothetical protein